MLNFLRPKITGKGLSLVALPLLFELLFALLLLLLLFQADLEIQKEWTSRQISSQLARLLFQIYGCATNAAGVLLNGGDNFKALYSGNVTQVVKCRIELDELVGQDKARIEVLAPLLRSSEMAFIRTGVLAIPGKNTSEVEKLLGTKDQLTMLLHDCDDIVDCQNKFLAHEHAIETEAPNLRNLRRQQIQALLMVAVATSVVLCVWLSIYFSSDICGRLMVIGDNVKRLRQGKKLLPPVGGHDELADLDAGFHLMAARLAESDAFKRQLIAFVSHELRTPLTSVSASLLLVESGSLGELPSAALQRIKAIEKDIEDVMQLSSRLLLIEKMEAGKLQLQMSEILLPDLLEDACQAKQNEADQCQVQIDLPELGAELRLRGDRKQLGELFQELLSNALKVSPAGSKICISCVLEGANLLVHVDDEGSGVPQELLAGSFDKFASESGNGLGLALCKAIVEQHGGNLKVLRRTPAGSRVTVSLPRLKTDAET